MVKGVNAQQEFLYTYIQVLVVRIQGDNHYTIQPEFLYIGCVLATCTWCCILQFIVGSRLYSYKNVTMFFFCMETALMH